MSLTLPAWLVDVVDVVQAYAQHVAIGAGIVGALIAARTIRRFVKHHEHDEVAANLGVLLFLVVTTEGMWEVVYHKLDVAWPLAVAMFAAYDTVIYGERAAALKALARDRGARIVGHLAVIWGLSIAASITVSFASGNTATWFFRFFSPLVGAALATQKILARRGDGAQRQESSWIWTPTRLMIRWGWLKPGAADDLTEVFAARRIAALVDAGLALHAEQQAARLRQGEPAGAPRWRMRRQRDPLAAARQRMQRLTRSASAEDVAAARTQLRRVLTIEDALLGQGDELADRERETLDEVRRITAQAEQRIRAEHARAFAPAPAGEPVVELGGIRMRASIAAQIGTQPQGESRRESLPAHVPARRTVTASVREPVQPAIPGVHAEPAEPTREEGDRLSTAYARLVRKLGREPYGAELGQAAGVSKATANRWKRERRMAA